METVISKDGTKITYDTYGDGPALIYVLGALCYRKFEPAIQDAQVFSQQFKVVVYDRRGRGDSTNTLPYSVDREVEDIEALIDVVGGSAFLYGHSSGAGLAFETALRLGDKVKKLAIYEPPYDVDEKAHAESVLFNNQLREILKADKRGDAIVFFLQGIGLPEDIVDQMKQSPQWSVLEALAPTLLYESEVAGGVVPIDRAAKLQTPTLIMYGTESYIFMKEVAEKLAKAMPHALLNPMKDQDHNVSAKLLLPVLSEFFLQ